MSPLIIHAEDNITPEVTLDNAKNLFEISGWSHPEDAIEFYAPVFEWLNQYSEKPNPETVFQFHFEYYNTASAKQIYKLLSILEDISKKSKTKIQWHYDGEDTDMLASGEGFSKTITVPFEFISH